jgi:hypothetical protein
MDSPKLSYIPSKFDTPLQVQLTSLSRSTDATQALLLSTNLGEIPLPITRKK